MNEIGSRYEFRVFASQMHAAERLLRQQAPCETSTESSDIYLLDCRADPMNNIKIRDGRLELKQLVDQRFGLQRWRPAGEWQFPVAQETIRTLWPDDIMSSADLYNAKLSLDALLKLVWSNERLCCVEVFKRRDKFNLQDSDAEFDRLQVNGRSLESCAVESRNPDAVLKTLKLLNLTGRSNQSYVQMLCNIRHN